MLQQPSLEQLTRHTDSRYALVVAVAKRARVLLDDGAEDEPGRPKPVTQALWELARGDLNYDGPQLALK